MTTGYIINGIGRCGTTLMHTFLMKYYQHKPFLVDMKDLDSHNITKNCVFKTHCPFPQNSHKNKIKVLFMFGDIYNSAISYSRKDVWGKNAAKHLFLKNHDINYLNEDLYKFKRHFDNWIKKQSYPVMIVRYEKLYENLRQILDFCDLNHIPTSEFPPYKERNTDWRNLSKTNLDKLQNIYGELKLYADSLPDIKIL